MSGALLRLARAASFVLAAAVAVAAAQPAAPVKGFIWEVERDGRSGWIVGSIHVLTREHYPLPPSMEEAFRRATTLVEEVDLDQLNRPDVAQAIAARAFYQGDQRLETELAPETYRLVAERIAAAGLAVESFRRMKPWMVALTLMALELKRSGFDAAFGLDRYFHGRAAREGKTFRALESPIEQIEFLESISAELQDELVLQQVDSARTQVAQVAAMADAWKTGDAAGVERLMLEPLRAAPRVYELLVVRRNRAWMPAVESCLAGGACFVVVGAAHVIGPDGLLIELRKRGYSVRQQ